MLKRESPVFSNGLVLQIPVVGEQGPSEPTDHHMKESESFNHLFDKWAAMVPFSDCKTSVDKYLILKVLMNGPHFDPFPFTSL
mmetsp:Transcript_5/g.13  ORF Transcript_5/g.13 Transcript_5/m.13 type:complete len:83 (+) Transcript_5:5082-5330(+)